MTFILLLLILIVLLGGASLVISIFKIGGIIIVGIIGGILLIFAGFLIAEKIERYNRQKRNRERFENARNKIVNKLKI